MRSIVIAAPFAVLIGACGGSPSTTVPPPSSNPPASVTIQTGDGQQAEPAATVAIKPAVLVRDASGQPVSGAVATFSVDSGGGTLAAASATTGTNGVATAGDWTLGQAEGRNVLKVTVGSLAPVKFVATAAIVGATLPAMNVGTGGGSISVTQAGPLNGFKLIVPSGALASPLQVTLSYSSSASVPHPAGSAIVGPLVTLSTSLAGYSAAPLTIHIPAVIPANTVPSVVLYDPSTGIVQPTSTVSWDANGISAALSQLGPATTANSQQAQSSNRPATLLNGTSFSAAVMVTQTSLVMADMTSAFLPGQDDWEFDAPGTILDTVNAITVGHVATEYWYFAARPNPAKLWQQYQVTPGVPRSNRFGIRWAALVDRTLLPTYFTAIRQWIINLLGVDGASYNEFVAIRTLMAQSPVVPQPQLVVLLRSNAAVGTFLLPVMVYKAIGNTLYIADPHYPGDATRAITFSASGSMNPYTSADGVAYDFAFPVTLPAMVPMAVISAGYQQVVAGTIGNAEFGAFPYQAYSKYGPLRDTIWVPDTLRVWVQCPNCSPVVTSAAAPEATASLTTLDPWTRSPSTSAWTSRATTLVGSFNRIVTPAPITESWGFVVSARSPGAAPFKQWIDWHRYTIVKVNDTVIVSPKPLGAGVPGTFTQQTQGPLPANRVYSWDFNDNTAVVLTGNNPVATHTFAQTGIYAINAKILDAATNQPLATATLIDTVSPPQFAWRFTSATAPVVVLPPGGIGSLHSDTLAQGVIDGYLANLHATPANNVLFVADSSGCRGAVLEQFPPGEVQDTGLVRSRNIALFATNCFDATTSTGTFAMGTLGSGALTGSFLPLPNLPPGPVIVGSVISATMTGTAIAGQFTWRVNYSGGVGQYTVQFQGTQIIPKP